MGKVPRNFPTRGVSMFVDLAPRCVKCRTKLARRRESLALRCTVVLALVGLALCVTLARWMARDASADYRTVALHAAIDLPCDAPLDESLSDQELDAIRVRCGTSDRRLLEAAQLYRRDHAWCDEIVVLRRLIDRRPDEVALQIQLAEAYRSANNKLLAAGER